jgi:hypothetical protein
MHRIAFPSFATPIRPLITFPLPLFNFHGGVCSPSMQSIQCNQLNYITQFSTSKCSTVRIQNAINEILTVGHWFFSRGQVLRTFLILSISLFFFRHLLPVDDANANASPDATSKIHIPSTSSETSIETTPRAILL